MNLVADVGRRQAMAFMGGTALAAAAAPMAASASRDTAATSRGTGSTIDPVRAYMLMRGALDDRLVIGCVSGRYYGVVEEELMPLFGVVSATFARYRALNTGGYEAVNMEYAYFTDPVSGKAMGPFRNPYTGETINVPAGGYTPAKITILPDLEMKLGRDVPGLTFEHKVLPMEMRGDDLWFTEVTRTSRVAPNGGKPFRYSESTILHARRSDLEQPGVQRVRCETSFTNVVGWRPWLNMGDRPGHMLSIGSGRYGITMDELPPAWIDATRKQHPELLADAAAILAPLWNAR